MPFPFIMIQNFGNKMLILSCVYQNTSLFCFRTTELVLTMACTMVYGDFSNIKGGYLAFAEWLKKNSEYQMSNPMRQIVHRGPWNENNPEKYLIELQIPLEHR